MRLTSIAVICALLAGPALAKPHLRDVPQIDNALMMIAIADEIRKTCDGIDARYVRAISRLNGLKSKAQDMGYSTSEIKAYTTSKKEKRRMRAKAEAYLADRGVDASVDAQLCRFGKSEIKANTQIGSLLR